MGLLKLGGELGEQRLSQFKLIVLEVSNEECFPVFKMSRSILKVEILRGHLWGDRWGFVLEIGKSKEKPDTIILAHFVERS